MYFNTLSFYAIRIRFSVYHIAKSAGIDSDEALLTRVVHITIHAEVVPHHSKLGAHNEVM